MKLKALVAALAIIGAGAANAVISTPTGSGAGAASSMLFIMMNTSAAQSAMFDLGLDRLQFSKGSFGSVVAPQTETATLTWNFTTNSVSASNNWGVDAKAAISSLQSANNSWASTWAAYSNNVAGSTYGVIASDRDGTTSVAQHLLTTVVLPNNTIGNSTNAQLLAASSPSQQAWVLANTPFGTHATSDNGANVNGNVQSYQGNAVLGNFQSTWNGKFLTNFVATAAVDKTLGFYSMDGVAGASGNKVAVANYGGSWSMDAAAGTLTYSAQVVAVPEPSSIAMLLAGLGLMGVIARRRLA